MDKEFERLAGVLRSRITDGTYLLGASLPSQRDLADEFVVSRDTVQRALRELAGEGWIESRRGSGSRVIKTQRIQSSTATSGSSPVTLGPLISEAFQRPDVALDVYTLTSESLEAHVRLQAERIRRRELRPQSITLRMLLPDESLAMPYPRSKSDPVDPRPAERMRETSRRTSASLRRLLRDLQTEELVPSAQVEIRRVPLVPAFKLYLLGGVEALHGMYEVIERRMELDTGEVIEALDVLGLGATLTHHVKDDDPDSPGSVFVDTMRSWFDSVWHRLSEADG
ncbi:winged helix-turn-helix domain-containing protein [Streptomyces sp. P17]|uniref:winged helix-turn-helix domain-containing protein n=1 Tax=Streptomyces sp. P17 TaxID=3074716 RepID=UPI0028F460EB|nr:winged helix-turn-helix domain-containing protein [Streptomyces sp. P17]MDT9698761.1 winged helix-turn-helix domain-containing protein [Streptomyces sp. P17]